MFRSKPDASSDPETRLEPPTSRHRTARTTAEIIFTSGATAEPKGVVLTHKNILANIVPIEREMAKYRKYTRPVPADPVPEPAAAQPHVRPGDGDLRAADAARRRRSSRAATRPTTSSGRSASAGSRCWCASRRSSRCCATTSCASRRKRPSRRPPGMHWAKRWWRYRRIHRMFGFKFWAMVVGAAPLDPELEAFWGRLGFLVVQGYGLTETAPIVTLNHPLHAQARRGRQADRRRRDQDRRRRRDPRPRRERDDRLLQRAGGDARGVRRTAGSTPATSASSTPTGGCSSAGARRK